MYHTITQLYVERTCTYDKFRLSYHQTLDCFQKFFDKHSCQFQRTKHVRDPKMLEICCLFTHGNHMWGYGIVKYLCRLVLTKLWPSDCHLISNIYVWG